MSNIKLTNVSTKIFNKPNIFKCSGDQQCEALWIDTAHVSPIGEAILYVSNKK